MNIISNVLYWISTGLLVPVIVLLIFFFIRALIMIGGFFGQYLQEKKLSANLYKRMADLAPSDLNEFKSGLTNNPASIFEVFVKKILADGDKPSRVELHLTEYELEVDKNISTSKVLTKIGPILGLMGTLIPMGPALVGLATGDIASMAYNMQVAFATTVVGLVVSAVGFVTQHVKERWAERSMAMMVYLSDIVKESEENLK